MGFLQLFLGLLNLIFTVKNLFYGAAVAGCLFHLRSIPKEQSFMQDVLCVFFMLYTGVALAIRSVKPYWLRILISTCAIGILYNNYRYEWGTMVLLSVVFLY